MRRLFPYLSQNTFGTLMLVFFCQLAMAGSVAAISLQDYRQDIKYVSANLSRTYSLGDDAFGNGWTKQDQLTFEKTFFTELPQRLPAHETVEWNGTEIEVDNRWLLTRVEDLKKLPFSSRDRDPIVSELTGRLS